MINVLRRTAIVLAGAGLLLLTACGGGGAGGTQPQAGGTDSSGGGGTSQGGSGSSGSSGDTPPPQASFTVTPATLSIHGRVGGDTPPAALTVQINNPTTLAVFVHATATANGISTTKVQQADTATTIELDYRSYEDLPPGAYDDTIQVTLCADEQCSQVIGSSQTVTSHYVIDTIPASTPGFLPSTRTLVARAMPFAVDGATASFDVDFVAADATQVVLKPSWTGNDIWQVILTPISASKGRVDIFYLSPQATGIGIFDDVLTLDACLDSTCAVHLIGSPTRIAVENVVSNVVPGPNGFTFDLVDGTAADMAWDSTRKLIYLSVPTTAPTAANSVAILDPVAEKLGAIVPVTGDPGVLALSDGNQYLYVGLEAIPAVQRLSLPSLAANLTIPFGAPSAANTIRAHDIKVLPGQPGSAAIALFDTSVSSSLGTYIYDDASPRPLRAGAWTDWIALGPDTNTLYGFDSESSGHDIFTLSVDATGAHILNTDVPSMSTSSTFGGINYDAGLVFADDGIVLDTATHLVSLPYVLLPAGGFPLAVLPDSKAGKVFVIGSGVNYRTGAAQWTLYAYDFKTNALITQIPLSGLEFPYYSRVRLLRWGADGLAFASSNGKVALIRGGFVSASN